MKSNTIFNNGLLGLSLLCATAGIVVVPLCCGLSLNDTTITSNKMQACHHYVLDEKLQKLYECAK